MGALTGLEIKLAAKKAAVWGTPVVCAANDGFLSLPTTLKRSSEILIDDSLGSYFTGDGSPGPLKCEGDIPPYLRYDGLDLFLAMFMGTAGVPVTHAAGTLSKDFFYQFKTDLDGLFFTFVKNMKNYVAEFPSVKVQKMTIKGEVGKPLTVTFGVIADKQNFNTSAGTNNQTTYNSVTIKEVSNRVMFSHGVFRINAQGGAALAPGDKVYPTSFELTAERKLTGQYGQYTTGVSTNNQDVIDEPTTDGKPVITLKLNFPRHAATSATVPAFLTAQNADTRYKADIAFTGKIIEGAIPKVFAMSFPHLQIKTVDVVDAQGIISEPVEFQAHMTTAAPTGMATADVAPNGKAFGFNLTVPMAICGTNSMATDPLA